MLTRNSHFFSEYRRFLSSMRFAISLLVLLATSSIIGTLVEQNQPYTIYINQFGLFWAPFFKGLGVYDMYNTHWYLLLLFLLVLSLLCCVYTQSQFAYWNKFSPPSNEPTVMLYLHPEEEEKWRCNLKKSFRAQGFILVEKEGKKQEHMILAKGKPWRFGGYFLTHISIAVIFLGALIDSNVVLKTKMMLSHITPLTTMGMPLTKKNIIPTPTLSYRGQIVLEKQKPANLVRINLNNHPVFQLLPFHLTLIHFQERAYKNGLPKQFSSHLLLEDTHTHQTIEDTISVNHPLHYKDFTIYQSGFSDEGSSLQLTVIPLSLKQSAPFAQKATLHVREKKWFPSLQETLEITEFKEKNIENMFFLTPTKTPKPPTFLQRLHKFFSSTTHLSKERFINLGPSFSYRIQGKEEQYKNFSQPININNTYWLFFGIRKPGDTNFRYLKIPTDQKGNIQDFLTFRTALLNPHTIAQTIPLFLTQNHSSFAQKEMISKALNRLMTTFSQQGFPGIFRFLGIHEGQKKLSLNQQKMIHVFEKICFFFWGKHVGTHHHQLFLDNLLAVSDSLSYSGPFLLQLKKHTVHSLSILDVTKSPGSLLIYGGSLFLCMGLIIMLYLIDKKILFVIRQITPEKTEILCSTHTNPSEEDTLLLKKILRKPPYD